MKSGGRGKAALLVCDETAELLSLVQAVSLGHVGEARCDQVGGEMCRSLAVRHVRVDLKLFLQGGAFPQRLGSLLMIWIGNGELSSAHR
jgi:hypothetical protein